MPQQLRCEVAYALPDRQLVVAVTLAEGASVRDAIVSSGICATHPELQASLDAGDLHVGVFGRIVTLDRALRDGDRVEIYRPLRIDPKAARRARAARTRR
jgi:putative ubiquitin-RnfH superfamily antitoxin RatB of RatAB toxin-antitoxin module